MAKYMLYMIIPEVLWEEVRRRILTTYFVSKRPDFQHNTEQYDRKNEYATLVFDSEFDVNYAIRNILPSTARYKVISYPDIVCKRCGKRFSNSKPRLVYKDTWLDRACWCPECKEQYASKYNGWDIPRNCNYRPRRPDTYRQKRMAQIKQ